MDSRIIDLGIVRGEWSPSRPGCFTPGERTPGTHRIGGWEGPRTGLDGVERRKSCPSGTWTPNPRPSHSLSRRKSNTSTVRLTYHYFCRVLLPTAAPCRHERTILWRVWRCWVIKPCSPIFRRNISPPSSGRKFKPRKKPARRMGQEALHAGSLLQLWRLRQYFSPKHQTFSDLHGVITKKTVLFIVTSARTSNPTQKYLLFVWLFSFISTNIIFVKCSWLHVIQVIRN
jgi:hypothetical protein